jgi:hypothetical protein
MTSMLIIPDPIRMICRDDDLIPDQLIEAWS